MKVNPQEDGHPVLEASEGQFLKRARVSEMNMAIMPMIQPAADSMQLMPKRFLCNLGDECIY